MKTNTLLCTFAFVCVYNILFAQSDSTKIDSTRAFEISNYQDQYLNYLPSFSPLSPQSAQIQKFSDYNVNLATGLPDISIELYTINTGELSVPVTLRYHAGGHKIREQASWVGWGWSLDYGGSMNRQIRGLADDVDGDNSYLSTPINTSRDLCTNSVDFAFAQHIIGKSSDALPDIYSFSNNTTSGKFILGQNGLPPLLFPVQAIKVSPKINTSNTITGFQIVNESGTEYQYGINTNGGYQAYETHTSSGTPSVSTIVSWLPTNILSPKSNDAIRFTYQYGGSLNQATTSWSASMIGSSNHSHYTNSQNVTATATTIELTSTMVHVQKITFPNGEIEFVQSGSGEREDITNGYFLEKINIYNYENGTKHLTKSIDFNYSYFLDGDNNDGRLKLDSLDFKDETGSKVYDYEFDYFTDSYSWNDSQTDFYKQDYWGFYNGQSNQSLITLSNYTTQNHTVGIDKGGANRVTSATYMKEAVLSKIVYPQKGYVTFDFETNKYKDAGTIKNAGGLRVTEIKHYFNPEKEPLTKKFFYESEDGIGVGVLPTSWSPSILNLVKSQRLIYQDAAIVGGFAEATQYIISPHGQLDLGSFDAAPVYYTGVQEFFENDTTTLGKGKNVYTYSFEQDDIKAEQYSNPFSPKPWRRGQLINQKTYNSFGNIVSEINNEYQVFKTTNRTHAGAEIHTDNYFEGTDPTPCATGMNTLAGNTNQSNVQYFQTTHNYISSNYKLVKSETKTDSVTISKAFSYNDNLLLDTTITTFGYSSKERNSVIVYPTHSTYSGNVVADSMVSRNMVGVPLEQIETESYGASPSTYFRKKNVFDFFSGNNARALTNNILPKETWVDLMGDGLEKRVDFVEYDVDGNLLEYMVDSVSTAFAYGYNNKLVIAKAERSTREDLDDAFDDTSASETDFETTTLNTAQLTDLSDMRTSLGNTRQLTWYSHIPHVGVSEIVSPKGMIQTFEYDDFQRLLQIKDDDGNISSRYQYHYADSLPSLCDIDPPVLITTTIDTCFITLEASGCSGTVNWNTGATGNTLLVSSATVNSYSATCTEGTCTSANSNTLSLPELYQGWNIAELGSPPIDGCVYHNEGTITLSSSGSGPAGTSDQFNYVYKSITADSMVFMARLESITDSPDENMRSGLMIRTSTASNAAYYEIIYDEKNQALGLLGRSSNGGTSTFIGFNFDTVPLWLRIKKKGNEISTWVSSNANPSWSDDAQWVQIGATQTNSIFNSGFLYGLDAYNGNYGTNSLINTSTFSNISIHTF